MMEYTCYPEIAWEAQVVVLGGGPAGIATAISATHRAAAAVRVMPTCFAMGEAAGVAAAISLEEDAPFPQLDYAQLRS